jgi:hypothetical protein
VGGSSISGKERIYGYAERRKIAVYQESARTAVQDRRTALYQEGGGQLCIRRAEDSCISRGEDSCLYV